VGRGTKFSHTAGFRCPPEAAEDALEDPSEYLIARVGAILLLGFSDWGKVPRTQPMPWPWSHLSWPSCTRFLAPHGNTRVPLSWGAPSVSPVGRH